MTEYINGTKLEPIFNFYTIIIKSSKTINDNFINELEKLIKKVKTTNKGIWLSLPELLYKKIDIKLLLLLQKEFTFYYNDIMNNNLIFIATKLKTYPPAPNTNIGTHLMITTKDNSILTTIENDGKTNTKISLPGGHIDLSDNGIEKALIREFGEEITKNININKNQLKLLTIRHIPMFPRLGNIYKNQDIWFLYKLELSKNDINKIIKNFKINNEVKSLKLVNIDILSENVNWLTKDIIKAIKENNNINIHNSKKAYGNNQGFFFY